VRTIFWMGVLGILMINHSSGTMANESLDVDKTSEENSDDARTDASTDDESLDVEKTSEANSSDNTKDDTDDEDDDSTDDEDDGEASEKGKAPGEKKVQHADLDAFDFNNFFSQSETTDTDSVIDLRD